MYYRVYRVLIDPIVTYADRECVWFTDPTSMMRKGDDLCTKIGGAVEASD